MNSLTDEELLIAWKILCEKIEKLESELSPLLQKWSNLDKEKQSLIEEFIKRGVQIKNEENS